MGRTEVAPYPPHSRWPPLLPGSLVALGSAARTSPREGGPHHSGGEWKETFGHAGRGEPGDLRSERASW
jgi:hypothetical protein